jgi:mycoredoxin
MAEVKLYSAWWCGHCHRLKYQLKRARIDYEEVDVERHPEISARIVEQTGGHRVIPSVTIGETLLVNPRVADIEATLRQEKAVPEH